MAKHTIARTDKMHGTYNAADLVNILIAEDMDNGCIVKIGDLADGEREAYDGDKPAVSDKLTELAIVISPEVMYDERLKDLADFYNKAGDVGRGYRFHNGDEFALTADGFTGSPAVGNIVEVAAAYKMKTAVSATSGSTQIGKIIAQEGDYYVVRVQG